MYRTNCPKQTEEIAEKLAKSAKPGDVFCLSGNLGAGKTVFAKGFAKGLKIKTQITSPTFTIINEYLDGTLPLYHFDVYRINSAEEMEDCGYEEYFYGEGVCLIEWAELIKQIIPKNAVWVTIEYETKNSDSFRVIKIEGLHENFST